MHLNTLLREQESRFTKNTRKCSRVDFAPMQSEGFHNSKWAGFFKPTGYKPMIILFWLFLIQQFSGIYITLFFAVTFFDVSGIDEGSASLVKELVISIRCFFFFRQSAPELTVT